jgi:hypothetical protein
MISIFSFGVGPLANAKKNGGREGGGGGGEGGEGRWLAGAGARRGVANGRGQGASGRTPPVGWTSEVLVAARRPTDASPGAVFRLNADARRSTRTRTPYSRNIPTRVASLRRYLSWCFRWTGPKLPPHAIMPLISSPGTRAARRPSSSYSLHCCHRLCLSPLSDAKHIKHKHVR